MGSFSLQCSLSGLPIGEGDAVQYLLLTQDPWNRRGANWIPRGFSVRAHYADYGRVEVLPEDQNMAADWLPSIWLEWVKQEGIEVPKTVQDITDLWDHRVMPQVWAGGVIHPHEKNPPLPLGVPTRQRVQWAMKEAGFTLGYHDYQVKGLGQGEVVVSINQQDPLSPLRAVQAALPWPSIVRAGSHSRDCCAEPKELLVVADPGCSWANSGAPRKSKGRRLDLQQAMVRQDVWDLLVSLSADTLEGVRDLVRSTPVTGDYWRLVDPPWVHGILLRSACPAVRTISDHFQQEFHLHEGKLEEDFIQRVAEFLCLRDPLYQFGLQWRPPSNGGPQCPEWEPHHGWLQRLAALAAAQVDTG